MLLSIIYATTFCQWKHLIFKVLIPRFAQDVIIFYTVLKKIRTAASF